MARKKLPPAMMAKMMKEEKGEGEPNPFAKMKKGKGKKKGKK